MAEYVFKNMVKCAGKESELVVSSSATSREEIGNPIYPPAARILQQKGIPLDNHRASQLTVSQIEEYDYIVCMDSYNLKNIMRISGGRYGEKISKLLDFADGGDISDPWYSGDFEQAYKDISVGCAELLKIVLGAENS